jgi:hypothetical protein
MEPKTEPFLMMGFIWFYHVFRVGSCCLYKILVVVVMMMLMDDDHDS